MNRSLFCTFLILCLSFAGFAQKNWRWQNPFPQGNTLRGSAAPAPDVIVWVGDAGTILKSKDNGQTFERQETHLKQDLYSVSFIDAQNGMAVGEDGIILKTTNCGETWEKLTSGRNDTLRGISMLSTQLIIAVGDTGTILRSVDGGDNWIYQPVPGLKSNLNGVIFPTPDFGTIVGDSMPGFGGPPIVFSGDSGTTFSPWGGSFPNLESKSFHSVWMPKADPNKAVLVGNEGLIMNTLDAGVSWNTPVSGTTVPLTDVYFFSDKDGFATGPNGVLLRTKNCGDTWSVIPTPISRNIITVSFTKDSTGYFGGSNGLIFRTPDGGGTFEPLLSGFTPNLTDVTFLDDSFGIAVGGQGSVLRTVNGGNDWLSVTPVTTDPIEAVTGTTIPTVGNKLWFAGGIFGGFGRIYASEDSGVTWKTQPIPAFSKLFGITMFDSLKGMAVGLNGGIYCTVNGGQTWESKTSGTNVWLLDVKMTNDSTGYAVGGFGTILKSIDSGNSWNPLTSGTQEWLTSISFLDDSFGIATGNHGVILRTEDAGKNWQDISPTGITHDFTSLSLFRGLNVANRSSNKNVGVFAVGNGGVAVYSPDGGDTWIEQNSLTKYSLTGCFFSDSTTGTVVGNFGTILRVDGFEETSVSIDKDQPREAFLLGQNYPNPIHTSTIIPFIVPNKVPVDLRIFDLEGREVDRLIRREMLPGTYEHEWTPDNLSHGIYICRLQVGIKSYSVRMLLNR